MHWPASRSALLPATQAPARPSELRRARKHAEAQAAQQGAAQAEAQSQQAVETFKNAAAVCLEGRGYTVR